MKTRKRKRTLILLSRAAHTLLAQVCGTSLVLFYYLGWHYMEEGYGLHPMLAGAGFATALALPWLITLDVDSGDLL